ncbi:MAG: universal stress protein [Proteobacteria bacterium]|nr:universal stress protein [Pseudomonadota bacterium]
MNQESGIFKGRVVVTTDFSSMSVAAFPYALEAAKSSASELFLVTFNETLLIPLKFSDFIPPAETLAIIQEDLAQSARSKLGVFIEEHFKGHTVKQAVLQRIGTAADAIVKFARSEGVGLIVIATHGRGFLGRVALGSVTERVMAHAPCPVLVVPSLEHAGCRRPPRLPYIKVAVTTDFSERSARALPFAMYEARRFDATLTVLHVLEELFPHGWEREKSKVSPRQAAELQDRYVKGVEGKLAELAASLGYPKSSAALVQKGHSVASSISEYARAETIDLVVITTKGEGNRRYVLGGVPERVVRETRCPVLVVPT